MRYDKQIGKVLFRMYDVRGRLFNVLLQHKDLQGDVYWMFTVIVFGQAFQVWVFDLNTDGKMTFPRLDYRMVKSSFKPKC